MTREELVAAHKGTRPIGVEYLDHDLVLWPKEFSTGSLGWHAQEKIKVDGTPCQVNFTITVIGSKPGWVSSAKVPPPPPPSPTIPGEQNGTMPEKPPETPQGLFETEKAQDPPKKSRKPS